MGGTQGGTRRLTLREASEVLGISVEAVRKRTMRGSLPSDIGPDGRRYVYLDAGEDVGGPSSESHQPEDSSLIAAKDETIRVLREELERAGERDRENRRIIAALTQRIPELEAPQEAPESPESVEQGGDRGHAPQEQERPATRPWWRRVFGR
jgi:hypothetical protein